MAAIEDDMLLEGIAWQPPEVRARIDNALINAEIMTVGQLRQISDAELLRIPNIGVKCVKAIRRTLAPARVTCLFCGGPIDQFGQWKR